MNNMIDSNSARTNQDINSHVPYRLARMDQNLSPKFQCEMKVLLRKNIPGILSSAK